MKALFLLLLLANLGLYAYSQGYLTPAPDNAELAQRSPLNADRIRLLSAAQVSAMPKIKIVPKMSACLEWGSLTLVEAARAEKAVASLALGDRLSQRRVDDPGSWWVFLPPQGSKPNAEKKILELKKLGVEEFYVVQDDGKWHFAVSLGVFSSLDGAKKRLETVRAKGVKTAQFAERQPATQRIVLQIRDGGEAAVARVSEIKAAYPGTEVRACGSTEEKRGG